MASQTPFISFFPGHCFNGVVLWPKSTGNPECYPQKIVPFFGFPAAVPINSKLWKVAKVANPMINLQLEVYYMFAH
jgi:hypothetical protein